MSGALESYVNRPVSVITADGRNFVGTLKVWWGLVKLCFQWHLLLKGLWPNHQLDPGRDSRARVQRHPGSWTGSDLLSQWWSIWNQIAKTLLFVILQPQVVLGLHIVRGDNICVVSGSPQRKRAWSSRRFATVRCRWARSTRTSTSVLIFTTSRSIPHCTTLSDLWPLRFSKIKLSLQAEPLNAVPSGLGGRWSVKSIFESTGLC